MLGAAEPRALVADAEGGLAVAGDFHGPLRVDRAQLEGEGVFVLRIAPDSGVRWLRAVGGAGFRAHAVALAADGDVVVAGEANGRCFAARLAAADGAEKWKAAAAGESSSCTALAPGGAWIAGSFSGVLSAQAASHGFTDVFVAQLTDAGEIRLVRAFGGRGRDVPHAIVALPTGEVLVAGQFGGGIESSVSAVDFGTGPVSSAGDFDGFLVSLRPDGKTRWVATFGESGDDDLAALAVGPGGAIFAAGHHQPPADFHGMTPRDVGNFTAAVLRYSPAGRGEWVRIFEGRNSSASSLTFDGEGRLWAAGEFLGDLRVGGAALGGAGSQDGFAMAFAPATGDPLGGRTFGSAALEHLAGVVAVPGGIAAAGSTRGEVQVCRKLIGSPGETTAFLAWLRDL
jgi:hypothetical protein